ncbi:MAG: hypothetical protein QUS07_07265 [Methanothrix sp.]|nr:hypothetical protein [Methanothrix sp.]
MNILAVDPGITTGYTILSDVGEPLEWGNLDYDDIMSKDSIFEVYKSREGLKVVIERVPIPTISELDRRLVSLMGYLEQIFPQAQWISPSTWKSISPIFNLSLPQMLVDVGSPHLRDAYRIGKWFLLFGRGGYPKGDVLSDREL